ncbi:unnamed protein product, partial [Cuscuta epithymum]
MQSVSPYDKDKAISPYSLSFSAPFRFSEHQPSYPKVPPGVPLHQHNGYRSHSDGYRSHYEGTTYENSRQVFGTPLDSI